MAESVDLYNTTYGSFETAVLQQVRLETYGEDVGQSGWLTADELRRAADWLCLTAGSQLLEVASGSGGPALFMTQLTGASVTGIDVNEYAVAEANKMAHDRELATSAQFLQVDAGGPLPFEDRTFDAITCFDSILHIPGRPEVFAEWHRVLKPGGRMLVTDPVVVSGLVTKEELAIRSSIGYMLFDPPGENERLLRAAGFELVLLDDTTESVAQVATRWHDARDQHREALIEQEGIETFEGLQRYLATTALLARERRLSRHLIVASKPGE